MKALNGFVVRSVKKLEQTEGQDANGNVVKLNRWSLSALEPGQKQYDGTFCVIAVSDDIEECPVEVGKYITYTERLTKPDPINGVEQEPVLRNFWTATYDKEEDYYDFFDRNDAQYQIEQRRKAKMLSFQRELAKTAPAGIGDLMRNA